MKRSVERMVDRGLRRSSVRDFSDRPVPHPPRRRSWTRCGNCKQVLRLGVLEERVSRKGRRPRSVEAHAALAAYVGRRSAERRPCGRRVPHTMRGSATCLSGQYHMLARTVPRDCQGSTTCFSGQYHMLARAVPRGCQGSTTCLTRQCHMLDRAVSHA